MSTRGWIDTDVAIAHLQGLNDAGGFRGLGGRDWATAREVAAALDAEPRATAQRLKALSRRGLVERVSLVRSYKTVPDKPARNYGWRITEAGRAFLAEPGGVYAGGPRGTE